MRITISKLRRLISEELRTLLTEAGDGSASAALAKMFAARAAAKEASGGLELYGNCGMVAIAVVKEAERRGIKDTSIILVHTAEDFGEDVYTGEYDIGHVVAQISGRYFDDRGEITKRQITIIDGDDLLDKNMSEVYKVEEFKLRDETWEALKQAIERNTSADKCPADFRKRAKEILDQGAGDGELTDIEADRLRQLVGDAIEDSLD